MRPSFRRFSPRQACILPALHGSTDIAVTHDDGRFRVGYAGSLVIAAWPGLAEPEDLDVFREAELEALRSVPGINLVIGLKLQGKGIDDRMRKKGEALQREFADRIVGQAVVLAGSGLVAATIRAFVSGLNLLSRAAVRTKTFGEPKLGMRWLAGLDRQRPEDSSHLEALQSSVAEFTRVLYEAPAATAD